MRQRRAKPKRSLAIANVANVSDLADVSDYAVSVTEEHNPLINTPPWSQRGHVFQHDRRTSVWALIAKVAIWAADEAAKIRPERRGLPSCFVGSSYGRFDRLFHLGFGECKVCIHQSDHRKGAGNGGARQVAAKVE